MQQRKKLRGKMIVVTVKCSSCGNKKIIGAREMARGDKATCDKCGSMMVAGKAGIILFN